MFGNPEKTKIYETQKTARQTAKMKNAITFSPHRMINNVFILLKPLFDVRRSIFRITGLTVFAAVFYKREIKVIKSALFLVIKRSFATKCF